MRNLKRALSLAMASVMLLGMMVVGTSAASFQDVDESNDVEAIEVMNAVGVMQGDERGFRPNDPINRNEIAKVMALLLKLTPEDYAYAVTPFTDVPDWAKPYVAACYANGITNGTSATTYSGANNVTAIQAARMMLRALGYLKNPEDDGDDWVLATATQASKIGLFDDVNQVGVHNALTRSQVATMAVNALEATMVEDKSSKGLQVNTPDGTTVQVGYTPNYVKIEVEREGDKNYAGSGTNDDGYGYQQLCEYLYGTDLKKPARPDDFGRPGSVWRYKGKEVVDSPDDPLVVYTKKPSESTIKSDLKGYDMSNVEGAMVNGVYVTKSDTKTYDLTKPAGIRDIAELGNGTRLEIYADDNEITDIIVIGTYLAQAASDYDAEEDELDITVKGSITLDTDETTLDGEDFAIQNYKEDDYLLITVADGKVQTVASATIVSGVTVSAYKDNDSVTAGGTKYDYNAIAKGDGSAEGQSDFMKTGGSYNLNKTEYDLILDSYGYVIGVKEASKGDRLSDYLFVKEAAKSGFTVSAKVVFMDGTTKTITVDQINDEDAKDKLATTVDQSGKVINKAALGTKVMEQAFYTYTENKDGTYDLDSVEGTQYMLPNASIEPDNSANEKIVDQDGSVFATKPATNKTVFVAKDKAYVGVASAPEVNGDKTKSEYVSWVLDKDGKYVLAVFSSKKGSSSVDASEYIYLLKDKATYGKDKDDNEYWEYDVIMGGKKTTIAASEKVKNGCGVYEVTGYTDGYADLDYVTATATNDTLAWKVQTDVAPSDITYDDDVLGVDGTYVVLKDAKVFSLKADDTDVKTVSPSALNNASTLDGTKYDVWVVEVSSSDDSVNTVYVVKKG